MSPEQHAAEARMERAALNVWIRRNGNTLAKNCERKGMTDQMIVAQQKGYWSA